MAQVQHRYVQTNGTNIHIAEQGSGPVVILLHGFPEIWYSWRHQIKALADAGFHAVAPDWRGFGLTESSQGADQLTAVDLVGDLVGLILALGKGKVYLAGHDIGAQWGWYLCSMRPDLVKGYVSFGVPHVAYRPPATEANKAEVVEGSSVPPMDGFYVIRFMQPGRADADFGRFDIRTVFTNIYKLFSKQFVPMATPSQEIMDLADPSEPLPSFLSQDDVNEYVQHYEKSGFSNPVRATYINIPRNGQLFSPWADVQVTIPSLLIVGETDYANYFPGFSHPLEELREASPGLKEIVKVPGGHFFQEQSPQQVNPAFIAFLKDVESRT